MQIRIPSSSRATQTGEADGDWIAREWSTRDEIADSAGDSRVSTDNTSKDTWKQRGLKASGGSSPSSSWVKVPPVRAGDPVPPSAR